MKLFRRSFELFLSVLVVIILIVFSIGGELQVRINLTNAVVLIYIALISIYLLYLIISISIWRSAFIKEQWFDLVFVLPILLFFILTHLLNSKQIDWHNMLLQASNILITRQSIILIRFFYQRFSFNKMLSGLSYHPLQFLIVWMLIFWGVGSLFLNLPIAHDPGKKSDILDVLFTVTAGLTGTGLHALEPSHDFSLIGEIILLLLIQVGGIFYMLMASTILFTYGRMTLLSQTGLIPTLRHEAHGDSFRTLLIQVAKYVFIIEGVGAIFLTLGFMEYPGIKSVGEAIYYGIFHSVSAFCNAGISLYPSNMILFQDNHLITGTLMFLVVSGSIGYIVLVNIVYVILVYIVKRKEYKDAPVHKVTVNTKVVLYTTLVIWLLGSGIILLNEFRNTLEGMPLLNQMYQSVVMSSFRTTGFYTLDISNFHGGTILFLTALMFIGGSPGSTCGGVKTSSAYLLLIASLALLTNRNAEHFKRRFVLENIFRAFVIVIISLLILVVSLFFLIMVEARPTSETLRLFVEVASAFANAGWSSGVTPYLTWGGKLILMVLMVLGRIVPLGIFIMLGMRKDTMDERYPSTSVMVG